MLTWGQSSRGEAAWFGPAVPITNELGLALLVLLSIAIGTWMGRASRKRTRSRS